MFSKSFGKVATFKKSSGFKFGKIGGFFAAGGVRINWFLLFFNTLNCFELIQSIFIYCVSNFCLVFQATGAKGGKAGFAAAGGVSIHFKMNQIMWI